jgi:TRAP transporter TAXI family solute receptor
MAGQKHVRRLIRDWVIAVVGLAALALAVWYYFRQDRGQKTYALTLTAGSAQGLRHQIAATLADESKQHGIDARVVATHGSEEMLDMINARRLDVALVQGGLSLGGRQHIRQVAALHVEPLHLLVKAELFGSASKNLAALRGKVVNLSEAGSGTHALALEVLRFAGLHPDQGGFRPATLGYSQLVDETDRAKLPDAVFLVSSLPSPVAKHLATRMDYRLVPLPFGEAFALDALIQKAPTRAATTEEVEKSYIYDATIPAFTYSVEPGVPPTATHTLGTRLLVVAHQDVSPDAIGHLLDTIFTTSFAQVPKPPLEPKLLDLPPEFPLHAGTVRYMQRNKPLIAGDVMAFWEKAARIGAPCVVGFLSIWQWWRQRRARQRELEFKDYILRVSQLEQRAVELESAAHLDLRELLEIQRQLNLLKKEALDRFAEGELEGKELMSDFVAMVNDARNYITRLMLHERDHLQERAQTQGRAVQEVWAESVADHPVQKPRPANP